MYALDEEEDESKNAGPQPGKYIAPGMRGDGRNPDRRSDENTCRVTNMPQELEEAELREMFAAIGRVSVHTSFYLYQYTNLARVHCSRQDY